MKKSEHPRGLHKRIPLLRTFEREFRGRLNLQKGPGVTSRRVDDRSGVLVENDEINVAIYSPQFARQMSALFGEDTAERFELTMRQWESRPWYNKVSERILS